MYKLPVILLAAGSSSRMQKPKQLLPWGDNTLLEHQITTLKKTGHRVIVVLGAYYEQLVPLAEALETEIVFNSRWEEGMGTSVAAGIEYISSFYEDTEGALIVLLDQPLVPEEHYKGLLSTFIPGKAMIAASQSPSGWQGVPAVFDRYYFDDLISLDSDIGAKKIIKQHTDKVSFVTCHFLDDADTSADYESLLRSHNKE